MKSSALLAAIALLSLAASEAHAQEANVAIGADLVPVQQIQRTPAMVIHEIAIPVSKTAVPDSARASITTSKKTNAKSATSTVAAATQGPVAQPPIIMPGPASHYAASEMVTTGNPKYDEMVVQSAARNGVDPNLLVAVMRQESGFNLRARSYKGASGLMQLMPATAQRFGVVNVFDPAQNIEGGARYLRFLLDSFNGDVNLALAGYNAGENAVVNSGYRVPRYRETQNYVRSISARYDRTRNQQSVAARAGSPVAPSAQTFSNGRLSNNY